MCAFICHKAPAINKNPAKAGLCITTQLLVLFEAPLMHREPFSAAATVFFGSVSSRTPSLNLLGRSLRRPPDRGNARWTCVIALGAKPVSSSLTSFSCFTSTDTATSLR